MSPQKDRKDTVIVFELQNFSAHNTKHAEHSTRVRNMPTLLLSVRLTLNKIECKVELKNNTTGVFVLLGICNCNYLGG